MAEDIASRGRPWMRADAACLGTVLLVAAALRFFHVGYGLPSVVYVDSFMYVGEAERMLAPGPYAPENFYHPSAYVDLLAGLYWLLDLRSAYARHVAARLVSGTFGLLLVALVFVAVRRRAPTRAATIAAALAAACPILLTSARVESTDSALVVFMTAAVLLAGRRGKRAVDWLLVGLLAGLAAGTKFTGLLVLPFVVLAAASDAVATRRWRPAAFGAVVAVGAAALVFAATTPWFFPHFDAYRADLETLLLIQRLGQLGRVQAAAWDYLVSATPTWEQPWLGTSLLGNLGPALFAVALLAWAWALVGGDRQRRWQAVFVLVFLAAVCGAGRLKAIRFLLPLLPFVYALVGWAVDRALRSLPRWAAPVAVLALLAYPAVASIRYVAMAAAPMSNEVAHAWLAANVARGSNVFVSPLFVDDLADLPFEFFDVGRAGFQQYRLPEGKGPSAERTLIYHPGLVDQLRDSHVDWVVLNSWFEDAFSPVPENLRYFPRAVAGYREFRERLDASADLVWRVEGIKERRLGPTISVYRVRGADG